MSSLAFRSRAALLTDRGVTCFSGSCSEFYLEEELIEAGMWVPGCGCPMCTQGNAPGFPYESQQGRCNYHGDLCRPHRCHGCSMSANGRLRL